MWSAMSVGQHGTSSRRVDAGAMAAKPAQHHTVGFDQIGDHLHDSAGTVEQLGTTMAVARDEKVRWVVRAHRKDIDG